MDSTVWAFWFWVKMEETQRRPKLSWPGWLRKDFSVTGKLRPKMAVSKPSSCLMGPYECSHVFGAWNQKQIGKTIVKVSEHFCEYWILCRMVFVETKMYFFIIKKSFDMCIDSLGNNKPLHSAVGFYTWSPINQVFAKKSIGTNHLVIRLITCFSYVLMISLDH